MKGYKIKNDVLLEYLRQYNDCKTKFTFCEYLYYIHGISIDNKFIYKYFFEENNIEYKEFVPNKEDSEQIVFECMFNI